MLTLSGPITSKDTELKTLFEGINPKTGEVLRRGANTIRHYKDGTVKKPVIGFDITCSAPKSVSVLWALTPDARVKAAIVEAQKQAVAAVASHIERDLSVVRVGAGGKQRINAAPVMAAFPHSTSRTLDPQLHTHLVLVNTALLHDGSGKALDGSLILRESTIQRLGAIYRNELEKNLVQSLQVKTIQKPLEKGASFELADVPDWVCEVYSTRTKQIESVLEPGDSVRQKQVKTLQTRPAKQTGVSPDQLTQMWQEMATHNNISLSHVAQQQREEIPYPPTPPEMDVAHFSVAQPQREETPYPPTPPEMDVAHFSAVEPLQEEAPFLPTPPEMDISHYSAAQHQQGQTYYPPAENAPSIPSVVTRRGSGPTLPPPQRHPSPPPTAKEEAIAWPTQKQRISMKHELQSLRERRDMTKFLMQQERNALIGNRNSRWKRFKQAVLYATGKITAEQYHLFKGTFQMDYFVDKPDGRRDIYFTPTKATNRKPKWYIHVARLRGRIAKKQSKTALLLHGHMSYDKFMEQFPKTRLGINLAYATWRIDGAKRMQLLLYHGHYDDNYIYQSVRKSNRERWQKLFAQKRQIAFEKRLAAVTKSTNILTKRNPQKPLPPAKATNVPINQQQTTVKRSPKNVAKPPPKPNNTSSKQNSQTQQPPQPRRKHER